MTVNIHFRCAIRLAVRGGIRRAVGSSVHRGVRHAICLVLKDCRPSGGHLFTPKVKRRHFSKSADVRVLAFEQPYSYLYMPMENRHSSLSLLSTQTSSLNPTISMSKTNFSSFILFHPKSHLNKYKNRYTFNKGKQSFVNTKPLSLAIKRLTLSQHRLQRDRYFVFKRSYSYY